MADNIFTSSAAGNIFQSNGSSSAANSGMSANEKALLSSLYRLEQTNPDFVQKPKPGLFDKGFHLFGTAMDYLSRPNYMTAEMLRRIVRGDDAGRVLRGGIQGLKGEKKTTGSDVLKAAGANRGFGTDVAGFGLDLLIDPLNWLSFGASGAAKSIGRAGAREMLSEAGEKVLRDMTETTAKRMVRKAAGRASTEAIETAAEKVAANKLLEKIGTKEGAKLFEQKGIHLMTPYIPFLKQQKLGTLPFSTAKKGLESIVQGMTKVPVIGGPIGSATDSIATANNMLKDVIGEAFTPGYKYTKELRELTATQKRQAQSMKLSASEAKKVFPLLNKEVQDSIRNIAKSKRYAAQQGIAQLTDMFKGLNPEEGKIFMRALQNMPGEYDKLSNSGKIAYQGLETLLTGVGHEQLEMGTIQRMVKHFAPRQATEEAMQWIKENGDTTNPAYRGLIKIMSPNKSKNRILVDAETLAKLKAGAKGAKAKKLEKFTSEFLEETLKTNTIDEVNEIAMRKLGFKWFEDDAFRAIPRYYVNFLQNKALHEGLTQLPQMVNSESGWNVFRKSMKGPVITADLPPGLADKAKSSKNIKEFMANFTANEKRALTKQLKDKGYKNLRQFAREVIRPEYADVLPGYQRLTLAGMEDWQAPVEVANQLNETYKILSNDESMNKFVRGYDQFMRKFKGGATFNIPFHSQNFLGGQFSNWQYGLAPGSHWDEAFNLSRKMDITEDVPDEFLDKVIGKGKMKDVTYRQLLNQYKQMGVGGGFFHGEVGDSIYRKVFKEEPLLGGIPPVGQQLKEGNVGGAAVSGVKKLYGAHTGLGETVENLNRLPIFIEEMTKHGDPRRAAKSVFKHHFDYSPEAYTFVEREFMQRLIPFYRFMRGNVPLQLQMFANQTGRMMAVQKAVRDLGGGDDPDKPEWMQDTFSIKIPSWANRLVGGKAGEKKFVKLPIPMAELSNLAPRKLYNSFTPVLKVPTEMIFNEQLFFGNHIWNEDLPPYAQTSKAYPILKPLTELPGVGPAIADAIKWREKPVLDPITDEPTGEVYYEADSKLVYALKQLGWTFMNAYTMYGGLPDEDSAEKLSSLVGGFSVQNVNPAQQKKWAIANRRDELSQLIGYLKARGMIPDEAPERKRGTIAPVNSAQGKEYLKEIMYAR